MLAGFMAIDDKVNLLKLYRYSPDCFAVSLNSFAVDIKQPA